jgi:hypothetical protein
MTDQLYVGHQVAIYIGGLEGRTPMWGNALRMADLTWPRSLTEVDPLEPT